MDLFSPCISYCKSIAMTNKEILQADMLDILFEHRNKSYGAYTLRRDYNNRLLIALGIALSAVVLFYVLSLLIGKNKQHGSWNDDDKKPVKLIQVVIPPKEIEPKPVAKQPPIAQIRNVPIRIVPDKDADQVPEQKDIVDRVISAQTVEGSIAANPNMHINADTPTGNGKTVAKTEPDFKVEEMPPSFPGGLEALAQFFSRTLSSPTDLEAGEKKIVIVRFVVGADGSITKAEIVQSGGDTYDREVLRAFKRMPRWNPAMQNGNKIAVSFTQPVTFVGVDQ
jgi:periplasmic protein TonB